MSLFGALIRTAVNVVTLPVDVVVDVVAAPADAGNAGVGHRTKAKLGKIKEESED